MVEGFCNARPYGLKVFVHSRSGIDARARVPAARVLCVAACADAVRVGPTRQATDDRRGESLHLWGCLTVHHLWGCLTV